MVAAALIGVSTAGLRYLTARFSNDHYLFLAAAQQVRAGEWPTRDFFDPGMPGMYLISAAADALSGSPLLGEALVVSAAFGLAAALTVVAAHQLSGSLPIAVAAALAEVAMVPRTYNHPKVLLYVAGPLLMWRYAREPGPRRLVALCAFIAVAGFIRHDHAPYLGIAAVATALLTPARELRQRLGRAAAVIGITTAFLAPYVAYVQANVGVVTYATELLHFNSAESHRTRIGSVPTVTGEALAAACPDPTFFARALCGVQANATAWLYYAFHVLPVIAVAAALVAWSRNASSHAPVIVVPLAITAMAINASFIRDPLESRLPDVIAPAVLLTAWLVGAVCRMRPLALRTVAVTLAFLILLPSAVALAQVGATMDFLDRSGVTVSLRRVPEFMAERTSLLRDVRSPRQLPGLTATKLMPFFEYVDRCTTVSDRLLVPGFVPEVPVLAKRLVAGGRLTLMPTYNDSVQQQRLVLSRLRDQPATVVLLLTNEAVAWEASFPLIAQHVRAAYVPVGEIEISAGSAAQVLVPRELSTRAPRDLVTGWPCMALAENTVPASAGQTISETERQE